MDFTGVKNCFQRMASSFYGDFRAANQKKAFSNG
jgi:hypothetical protein